MSQRENPQILPITGYFDRLSVRPGHRLEAKVSAQGGGDYEAEVVRIISGDPNPAGPGLIYRSQDFGLAGRYPARRQAIDQGSYALVPPDAVFGRDSLLVDLWVQPWLLRAGPSVLAAAGDPSGQGWRLEVDESAIAFVHCGSDGKEYRLSLKLTLSRRRWYRLWAGHDRASGRLLLGCAPGDGTAPLVEEMSADLKPLPASMTFSLAARASRDGSSDQFNGRLEEVALHRSLPSGNTPPPQPSSAPSGSLLAWWDFALGIETQSIVDLGPRALGGRLVNLPTRAVCGRLWDGSQMHWRAAPRHYAAIHFHEDDLYDCGWDTDFAITVPEGTPSGVYGLRLRQGEAEDILPFYVLPPRGKPGARLCFLASSFTYQAYANHARGNCDEALRARMQAWGATPYNPDDYPVYGRSTYNFHPDGSGTAFSSRLRPTLTIRPNFLTFVDQAGSGLRHFSADTHLLTWLESRGLEADVVTDEDLDDEGPSLLEGYAAVMTGSHPEYHTTGTLDALEAYTAAGGNLVYLGGNGFYWRVTRAGGLPGVIELRRAEGGIRAWAAEPGEYYHQFDGTYGGLWRRNGRPPQRLGAVGFSSQGLFEGSYYRRLPASERPEVAWIFEGVEEEKLGDYGLSGGGAAGFELDRADFELGTPKGTVILARSEGHSGNFVVVPEELLSHIGTVSGEPPADLIRGEIVFCPLPGGGSIFAVGSITFCGSLNHAGGENGVSRMLENVLRRFGA